MSNNDLKVRGVPEPKGSGWLKEVQLDAARNTIQQLRAQKEKQEYELAKANGVTVTDIINKGMTELGHSKQTVAEPEEVSAITKEGKK